MRYLIVIVVVLSMSVAAHAQMRKVDFEQDAEFTQAGRVGVWTKADSVTHFDDLMVTSKWPER